MLYPYYYLLLATLLLVSCESPLAARQSRLDTQSKNLPVSKDKNVSCEKPFNTMKLCATLAWETPPKKINDPAKAKLTLTPLNQEDELPTIEMDHLKIFLFMPAHRHGSPENTHISEESDGVVLIENIVAIMPGHWQLKVQFLDSAKTKVIDENIWDIHL